MTWPRSCRALMAHCPSSNVNLLCPEFARCYSTRVQDSSSFDPDRKPINMRCQNTTCRAAECSRCNLSIATKTDTGCKQASVCFSVCYATPQQKLHFPDGSKQLSLKRWSSCRCTRRSIKEGLQRDRRSFAVVVRDLLPQQWEQWERC